jgi:hypothetical protein
LAVDDVDRVVLPVGPGDAEEEREPAPEAQAALLREPTVEEELVPDHVVIAARLLRHAVHEHLELAAHARRKLHSCVLHRAIVECHRACPADSSSSRSRRPA